MIEWVAVDWGTSSLRAYAMAGAEVLAEAQSAEGMGGLAPSEFEPALRRLIGAWLPAPVLACGMVGAKQGWAEAPYRATPCAPFGTVIRPETTLDVRILGGLMQAEPADVMRGEEVQIAGFLAQHQGFEGALCLPGTHSKWALIAGGQVLRFATFMTGELFALLSTQSVLRHSAQAGEGFARGLQEGFAGGLAGALFSIRAEHLLKGEEGRGRLSGLLIGAELQAAQSFWQGRAVAVIGAAHVAEPMQRALATLGQNATVMAGDHAVLAGLASAWQNLKEAA